MMTLHNLPKKEICQGLPISFTLIMLLVFLPLTESYSQKAHSLEEYVNVEGEKNSEFLLHLVFDNIPTIIIKDSNIQTVGEGFPQKLSLDINSISALGLENNIFRTVKLLQINLGNESEKSALRINLEKLNSFSNIAYILIHSDIPLTSEEVEKMFTGFQEGDIVLLYQVNSNF
jgi:hypothetical protein